MQSDHAGVVQTSTESLLAVINGILDFCKIEAGQLDLETIDFSLRETAATALKPLRLKADGKKG